MVEMHPYQPKMVMAGKLTFFTGLQILVVKMMMLARAHTTDNPEDLWTKARAREQGNNDQSEEETENQTDRNEARKGEENSRLGVGVLGGLLKAKSGGGASFGRTRDLSREEEETPHTHTIII